MTGALDEQHFLVKVRQEKPTDYLVQTSRKEVAKGEINVIIYLFPNVQHSKLHMNADSETGMHINTQQNVPTRLGHDVYKCTGVPKPILHDKNAISIVTLNTKTAQMIKIDLINVT